MAGEKELLESCERGVYRVFGSENFTGNPTTVHGLDNPVGAEFLMIHARHCSTVDNAYYWPGDHGGHYHLRCFSHQGPILICGHALLAAAHHLLRKTGLEQLVLESSHYRHLCALENGRIQVEVPAFTYDAARVPEIEELLQNAGVVAVSLLQCDNHVWVAKCGLDALRRFDVRGFPWGKLEEFEPGALILSAPLPEGSYALRYFSPWYGKTEDSATGSAQCYLAPIWLKPGAEVEVLQWSPAGTGVIETTLLEDAVRLGGRVEREE